MGRTPAVQPAPGVWRISTAPADLVNSFAFVNDDGQVTLVDAGLKLHTPGHTPGHVALLHEPSAVLITGDSIWNMRRRMTWPFKALCTDSAMTELTASVLGEVDYDVVAFTHGPEIRDGAREAVRGFLRDKAAAS